MPKTLAYRGACGWPSHGVIHPADMITTDRWVGRSAIEPWEHGDWGREDCSASRCSRQAGVLVTRAQWWARPARVDYTVLQDDLLKSIERGWVTFQAAST